MNQPIGSDLVQRWRTARASAEGRRSVWTTIGLVGSSAAAAFTVLIAARRLGTAGYGLYAGIGALVGLAATFGALGTKEILLQRVTRDRAELSRAWGVLLAANGAVGVPLLAITILAAAALLPDRDLMSIALIAAAEYVSAGLVKGPASVWVALDRFPMVAGVNIFDALLRLAAASTLLFWTPDIRTLAEALAVVMALGAIVVNLMVWRVAGRPRLVVSELIEGCRKGAPYSVATISNAVQSNIDQFMLVRARLDVDAGLYAAGVRFVAYSMLPLHALTSATVPEFYGRGHGGVRAGLRYARKLRPSFFALSLLGAAGAIAVATPLGRLFGDRFDGVFAVVVALALFPLIRSSQTLVGSALLGSGHQSFVARIGIATAALNVLLNLPLIPWLGWWGAVVATYVSEITSLILLLVGARRLDRDGDVTPGPGVVLPA